jgi:predicted nuclease of predicted toxin-antitoxin system
MKILLDENLSQRLIALIESTYPGCVHVETVFERGKSDSSIWAYARDNAFTIVSKDNDFRQRVFVFGPPPKVIWLNVGNAGTNDVAALLLAHAERIKEFHANPDEGLLVLP